jgi:hypothetical protein
MLIGKRFRIERATLSVEVHEGNRKAVIVPAGAIIEILSEPEEQKNALVKVNWEDRTVSMFAVDVSLRGTEIVELSVGA